MNCIVCLRTGVPVCDGEMCQADCKFNHSNIECDKYGGEWKKPNHHGYNQDDDADGY